MSEVVLPQESVQCAEIELEAAYLSLAEVELERQVRLEAQGVFEQPLDHYYMDFVVGKVGENDLVSIDVFVVTQLEVAAHLAESALADVRTLKAEVNAHSLNFLPWRLAARSRRRRLFLSLTAFVLLPLLVILAVYYTNLYDKLQNGRIKVALRRQQVAVLKHRLTLGQQLARLNQAKAAGAAWLHLFGSVPKQMPASVRLTQWRQQGTTLTLSGQAGDNESVAHWLRYLNSLPQLDKVALKQIESAQHRFVLQAKVRDDVG